MKPTMILGIVLIVLGVAALIFPVVKYTTREKVVDLPGVQISADRHRTLAIPAIAGGLALAGGIVVVVVGARKA